MVTGASRVRSRIQSSVAFPARARGVPTGCCGDINSKGMFRGGVELSQKYGRMLGDSYIRALGQLKPSRRDGLDYATEKARIPLESLPSEIALKDEIAEMEAFIRRAAAGDEDTLGCVAQFSKN